MLVVKMAFNYLEFWSCEDDKTTQKQNENFKESVKGEVIQKLLLTNKLLIVGFNKKEIRQRKNDLTNFFISREKKTLSLIRKH